MTQQKLKAKGDELQKQQLEDTKTQMEQFRSNLEEFAYKYKKQIRKDPDFRRQFNELCMKIGVDPLACMYYQCMCMYVNIGSKQRLLVGFGFGRVLLQLGC